MRLKIGNFLKHLIISRTRERKSPIDKKGLFKAFKTFSESQFHTSKELDARDGIIVEKHIFLASHIIQQGKGRDLVVHLVISAETNVKDVFQLFSVEVKVLPVYHAIPHLGITSALIEESRVEGQIIVEVIGQFQFAFRCGTIPSVLLHGRFTVVIGKAQICGEAVAQLHADIASDGHRLCLVIHKVESIQQRIVSLWYLIGTWDMVNIQRVIVGLAIAHTQMKIHDFRNIGTDTAFKTEFHVSDGQRRIDCGRHERVVLHNLAEAQQLAATVQARVEFQLLIQNKQATTYIGAHGQEFVLF